MAFSRISLIKAASAAVLLALLTACAGPARKPSGALPAGLQGLNGTAPLACSYAKQVAANGKESGSVWNFWRWPERTETRDEYTQQGEIWQRDAGGRIYHTRLFYPERVALEYMPGDLAATGHTPIWEQLQAGLVDPRQLGTQLRLTGQEQSAGLQLEQYSGTVDGIVTEVDWLPSLRLVSHIAKRFPAQTVTLEMRECRELAQAQAQPLSSRELDSYRHIDFTDLGDMESDPMVQRIVELAGGHSHPHPHEH